MYTKEYAEELRLGTCSCGKSLGECLKTQYCESDAVTLHNHINALSKGSKNARS